MELSLWANHPKDQPSLLLRSAHPRNRSLWGATNSLCSHQISGSWRFSARHTMTDIRNQSPVILSLVGLLRRTVASCVPLAIPPDQKYNSLGALCDSLLIAPSLLHRESGAVSRPIHSLRNPYWFSGSLSLRYRHQSINIQPPLWWELAVALNPILRSWTSRFFIMSYSTIPKRFCQGKSTWSLQQISA